MNDGAQRCGCLLCNLCKSFFNSTINVFIFSCADPETYDCYYYFADRPNRRNSSAHKTKNQVRLSQVSLRLSLHFYLNTGKE